MLVLLVLDALSLRILRLSTMADRPALIALAGNSNSNFAPVLKGRRMRLGKIGEAGVVSKDSACFFTSAKLQTCRLFELYMAIHTRKRKIASAAV